jgi:hypothetical protein
MAEADGPPPAGRQNRPQRLAKISVSGAPGKDLESNESYQMVNLLLEI